MAELLFASVEIGNCVTSLDGSTLGNGAAGVQERFGELGLAGAARPDQSNVANVSCFVGHKAVYLPRLRFSGACHDLAIGPIPKNAYEAKGYGHSLP